MEDIAAEVGMPASGIYRYFAGKADMLAASFRRAADRVSGDLANVVAAEPDPDQAMMRLISSYVARSFDDPELAYLYYTERVNLPADDQVILRSIQRSTVESWVRLLVAVRPELTAGQCAVRRARGFRARRRPRPAGAVRQLRGIAGLRAPDDGSHPARPAFPGRFRARLVAVGATTRAEIAEGQLNGLRRSSSRDPAPAVRHTRAVQSASSSVTRFAITRTAIPINVDERIAIGPVDGQEPRNGQQQRQPARHREAAPVVLLQHAGHTRDRSHGPSSSTASRPVSSP